MGWTQKASLRLRPAVKMNLSNNSRRGHILGRSSGLTKSMAVIIVAWLSFR